MTRADTLRTELARLKKTEADLRRDLGREEDAASKARAAAGKKRKDASTTKSESTRRTATTAAEREDKKVATATKNIGDISGKLAVNSRAQATKQASITAADRTAQQSLDRDEDKRRAKEKSHAREVARLSNPVVQYVHIRPPQPEALRVLYLTANPEATDTTTTYPDGRVEVVSNYLRLDREVRAVEQVLRGAKYRDLVDVKHRPAATAQDFVDALNDLRPHVVHFSGHGWGGGVVFDDGNFDNPGESPMEYDFLAKVLTATDNPPQLLVLNACESLEEAELLLPAVPVVIAMAASIDDTAAIVFARSFYAAIASAQPVGRALEQSRNAMEMTTPDDADLPNVRFRDDVDPETLILVRPEL